MSKTVPKQQPALSKQDVGTPKEFLDAVEKRFGKITLDLAAHQDNHVCDSWLGPGGLLSDSLSSEANWKTLSPHDQYTGNQIGICYLNPPFGNISDFVYKCAEQKALGNKIAVLLPMALETKWYTNFVYRQAYTLILKPRLKFVGHENVFPKGLILAYYDNLFYPKQAIELWDWKSDVIS
jgi:hypothetical protein